MNALGTKGFVLLKTATKIAAIFVAIVSTFSFAMDRGESDETVMANSGQVIEAPHQPKRALSAIAAPAGALRP